MSQVLIVGAGPVGLLMAAELKRHGVSYRLVERALEPHQTARATNIHSRSLEILEQLGLAPSLEQAGRQIHQYVTYVPPRREIFRLPFAGIESAYPYVLSLEQFKTEQFLTAHLAETGVRLERGLCLEGLLQDESQVVARLIHPDGQRELLEVPYLAACDGAHSSVRSLLGARLEGDTYPEDFVTCDAHLEGDGEFPCADSTCVFLAREGSLSIYPMAQGRYVVFGELGPAPDDKPPQELPTLQLVQDLVNQRGPGGLTLSDPRWRSYFRIHSRQVSRYRHGRVFLLGDAAHIQSPIGGKGMNTGFQDAYNLAWKLSYGLQGRATPSLLESYHEERHLAGRDTLEYSDEAHQKQIEANYQPGSTDQVRGRFTAGLTTETSRYRAVQRLGEISLSYRGTAAVQELDQLQQESLQPDWRSWSQAPQAGDRAPDARLCRPGGEAVRLFEILRGRGHHLLILEGRDSSPEVPRKLSSLMRELTDRLGSLGTVHRFLLQPPEGEDQAWWWDREARLHQRYGAHGDCLYWVRPDGHLGWRSRPARAGPLLRYLNSLYGI